MTALRSGRALWALVAAALLVRLALSLYQLDRPGLQYDEVLFVNAADERVGATFIHSRVGGVPTMVFPYIGALKSWLYTPLFTVIDVGPWSVRLPMVLLVCAALAALFAALRPLIGSAAALVAFLALCFAPDLFWFTRHDVGPSALEFALKCIAILLIARWWQQRDRATVLALVAVLALGVFNKLNFIWYVNAALVVSLVLAAVYRRHVRGGHLLAWFGGLAVLYAVWAWWFVKNDLNTRETGLSLITERWPPVRDGIEAIFSGTMFHNYALDYLATRSWVALALVVLFVAGAVAAIVRRAPFVLAMAGMTLLTVAQLLVTEEASAGWHYIGILPFATIVMAHGTVTLAALARRPPWLPGALTAAVAAALVVYGGAQIMASLDRTGREPANAFWTPAVYALADDVQRRTGKVVSTDWGIHTVLLALDASPRYEELAFANTSDEQLPSLRETLTAKPPGTLVVVHGIGKDVFAGSRMRALAAMAGRYEQVATIEDGNGDTVFELWKRAL